MDKQAPGVLTVWVDAYFPSRSPANRRFAAYSGSNPRVAFAPVVMRLTPERTSSSIIVHLRTQGVRLGRPREISSDVVERIGELQRAGLSVPATPAN